MTHRGLGTLLASLLLGVVSWPPPRTRTAPAAGRIEVGFAFIPARRGPAIGTLVPHEGGPGYSTTGTGASYAAMYGPQKGIR